MKLSTNLLSDSPIGTDAFGGHARIADEILALIRKQNGENHSPRSIALLGDWGSGKSSVIRMLRDKLTAEGQQGPVETVVFLYDAWAHEGDGLRRAFLDALTLELSDALDADQKSIIRRDTWDTKETTTTTTEPVLRPYARALLLSLVPVPFALSLFGNYPPAWFEIYAGAWSVLMLLILSLPLVLLLTFALIQSLGSVDLRIKVFGTKDEEELSHLNLTSFLFKKTDGQIDHKWTTSPVDSIQQFKTTFQFLCKCALHKYHNVVIVVDNIDRLEREEARGWSTMQAFFDKTGWSAGSSADGLWLIVPFSPHAVTRYFGSGTEDGLDATAEARSFIDKSFDISFHIPPPIQVDSRTYFLKQLQGAFPEHDTLETEAVRNLFDSYRSRRGGAPGTLGDAMDTRKTPRQIKLFINQLVALYRVSSNDVTLPAMALYLLLRDAIAKNGLTAVNELGNYELSQLQPYPDPIQQVAAVHFGVRLDDAAQVLLADPIRRAIDSTDFGSFRNLSTKSGFVDVLQNVVAGRGGKVVGAILDEVAFLEDALEGSELDLHSTWTCILSDLEGARHLGNVSEEAAISLVSLSAGLYPSQLARLRAVVALGLSRVWLSEEDNGGGPDAEPLASFEVRMERSKGWTRIASALALIEGEKGSVDLPGYPGFVIRVIDEISTRTDSHRIRPLLNWSIDLESDEYDERISIWPGVEEGPTHPVHFCNLVKSLASETPKWAPLITEYSTKIASTDPRVARASLTMLTAIALQGGGNAAAARALKTAIENGQAGSVLTKIGASDVEGQAYGLLALLGVASENTPEAISKRGRPTDKVLVELITSPTDTILEAAAALLKSLGAGSKVIFGISGKESLYRVSLGLFSRLQAIDYEFRGTRSRLVSSRSFLEWADLQIDLAPYFEKIAGNPDFIADLGKAPVDERSVFVAHRLFRTANGNKSVALRNRLKKYLDARTKDQWRSVINQDELLPLEVARDVRAKGKFGILGVPAFDALLDSATETTNGGAKSAFNEVAELLDQGLRESLVPRFWSRLQDAEPTNRLEAVRLARNILTTFAGTDVQTVASSVLIPMIASPTTDTIEWMVKLVVAHAKDFDAQPTVSAELRARVNQGLRKESSLSDSVKRALRKLQRALPNKRGRAKKRG